jgi:hypothetical protein
MIWQNPHEVLPTWVSLHVGLQRHRPHTGLEVEQTTGWAAQPVCKVVCVGQGGGQAHKAEWAAQAGSHIPAQQDGNPGAMSDTF